MKRIALLLEAYLLGAAFWLAAVVTAANVTQNMGTIEQLIGLEATMNQQEGVFKGNFRRNGIQATAGGNRLIRDQGLTAWAAFLRAGDYTTIIGDIVLLENEINPVMSAALDNWLEC